MSQLRKVPVPENTLQCSRHLGAPWEALLLSGKWMRREHGRAAERPPPTSKGLGCFSLAGNRAERKQRSLGGNKVSCSMKGSKGENGNPTRTAERPWGILSIRLEEQPAWRECENLNYVTNYHKELPAFADPAGSSFQDLKGHLKATHQGPPTREWGRTSHFHPNPAFGAVTSAYPGFF